MDDAAARRVVEALWARNRPTTLERLALVQAAIDELAAGRLEPDRRNQALSEAHKLRGILGTYGFAEASVVAGEAEDLLQGAVDGGGPDGASPPTAAAAVLATRLAELVGRLAAD